MCPRSYGCGGDVVSGVDGWLVPGLVPKELLVGVPEVPPTGLVMLLAGCPFRPAPPLLTVFISIIGS